MSSEEIFLVAKHPFVQKFVFEILQNIRARGLIHNERYVINADLVPRTSGEVMRVATEKRAMQDREQKIENKIPVAPSRVLVHRVMPQKIMPPRIVPQKIILPQPQIVLPQIKNDAGLSQDYGKITPLLNDASISTIECFGAGKSIMVVRAGLRQPTRIVLSADEISEFLEKVSDAVHIPILEGVFRAAVDNFFINAVVSDIIGSRFVIKKQTAYSMFER